MDNKYEVVKFIDNQFELDVRADKEKETVWLTQKEMAYLRHFFLFYIPFQGYGQKRGSWI